MTRDYAFAMAIRYFGTLENLAKKIGVKPKTLLYQRNHAKQVSLRIALKIEIATHYVVRRYHLTEEKDEEIILRLEKGLPVTVLNTPPCTDKLLSELVYEAMMLEKEKYGNRQGERTDLPLRQNFDEVAENRMNKSLFKGRTDEEAAKTVGISRTKYRQAKKVLLYGSFELIKAMDDWLAAYLAAALATYSVEKQQWILNLPREEIIAYAKGKQLMTRNNPVEIA
jgi:DNA-binding XRE family transcriptional regulator